jgi:ankyrin repeat protein
MGSLKKYITAKKTTVQSPTFDYFVRACGDPTGTSQAFEIIKILLADEKIERKINDVSTTGETPLTEASKNGNTRIVNYLLEHGAEPGVPNSEGKTPFIVAKNSAIRSLMETYLAPLPIKMAMWG